MGARSRAGDVDGILRVLARRACQVAGVHTCSAYLRDSPHGPFRGRAIHNPVRPDALEWLRHSEAGIAADEFTRQIVETRRPVVIENAQRDPRPVRAAMREWGIDEMLGVPMIVDEEVIGLLYLDNRGEPHDYAEREQLSLLALANVAAIAVRSAQETEREQAESRALVSENRALRQAAAVRSELTQRVLEGGGVGEMVDTVAEMTGKACAILSEDLEQLGAAMAPGGPASWSLGEHGLRSGHCARAASALAPGTHTVIEPRPAEGVFHRLLLVRGPEHPSGCFVAFAEHGRRFSGFDVMVAEHTAILVSAHSLAMRFGGRSERVELAGRDLARSARLAGIEPGRPQALFLVRPLVPGGPDRSSGPFESELARACVGSRLTTVPHQGGLAGVLETAAADPVADRDGTAVIARTLERTDPGRRLTAAAVRVADGREYPQALGECERILGWRDPDAHAGTRVLGLKDLGVARLLLCADSGILLRHSRDTLGELLSGSAAAEKLLQTLRTFVTQGRSVRAAALALGVHENTVRYRLGRVREVTGLDVIGDPEHQIEIEVALLAFRAGSTPMSAAGGGGRGAPRPVHGRNAYEPMPTA